MEERLWESFRGGQINLNETAQITSDSRIESPISPIPFTGTHGSSLNFSWKNLMAGDPSKLHLPSNLLIYISQICWIKYCTSERLIFHLDKCIIMTKLLWLAIWQRNWKLFFFLLPFEILCVISFWYRNTWEQESRNGRKNAM